MNGRTAVKLTRSWVSKRTAIRRQLIILAREANPHNDGETFPDETFWDKSVRRLWHYPSDLNEGQLLMLIDHGPVDVMKTAPARDESELRPVYDESQVRQLAQDVSELLILPGNDTDGYERMARKLYASGWRKQDERATPREENHDHTGH